MAQRPATTHSGIAGAAIVPHAPQFLTLPETEDKLLQQVRDQARLAIDEAQAVILVIDGMAGLTSADEEVARMLRKSGKPTFVAVNKIDSTKREMESDLAEAYRLG